MNWRARGFTLLESMVVLLIISWILQFLLILFCHSIRSTTKGQDLLIAIREAHKLFFSIRKNMLECETVFTADPLTQKVYHKVEEDQFDLGSPSYSKQLTFFAKLYDPKAIPPKAAINATTTYFFIESENKNSYIEQDIEEDGVKKPPKQFAVPRMKEFNTLLIKKKHKLSAKSALDFETRHLFVEIVLKSDDPRKSKREIRLSSFFTPSNLSRSVWIENP